MPERIAHDQRPAVNGNGSARVSFSELVRAHHQWDASDEHDEEVRGRFAKLRADFEASTGEIVDAYWCREAPSGVALTRRELLRRGRLIRRRRKLEYRLHRVSDWVTGDTHEIADLLHDCDILAIKAAHGLDGVPRAVVMQWLLLVESHLLGFIERHRAVQPSPGVVRSFAASERAELRRIEEYTFRSGEKRAKMHYVEGMLGLGVALLVVLSVATAGVLALFGGLELESSAAREFYASAAAGGVGAVISVLMRMSGRGGSFAIDHELSRWEVTLIGSYRPLIGSVSGIVVYFLFQTTLVPVEQDSLTLPFFVVVSFLAGFSERWTRMMLSGAMRTVADREPQPDGEPVEPEAGKAAAR
ncbi:MAG: hypothetical protein H0V94_09400 [Actinobacteria bacterium]|nr:hypothetical protein [Actinomycetota bacterium]